MRKHARERESEKGKVSSRSNKTKFLHISTYITPPYAGYEI